MDIDEYGNVVIGEEVVEEQLSEIGEPLTDGMDIYGNAILGYTPLIIEEEDQDSEDIIIIVSSISSSEFVGTLSIPTIIQTDILESSSTLSDVSISIIMVAANETFSSTSESIDVNIPYSVCILQVDQMGGVVILTNAKAFTRYGDTLVKTFIDEDIKELIVPVTRY